MKRQIKLNSAAIEDLREIGEYLAQNNPTAARKLLNELIQKFRLLRDNPLLGRARDDLLLGLRCFPHKSYLVFYLPLDNGVEVFRVVHQARDIAGFFKRFFDSLR